MATEYTLLQLVAEFCKGNSLPIPATVTGAQDETTLQVWGVLNEGVRELADRYNMEELVTYLSFSHANGANYLAYDFGTNSPDWKFMIPKTLWCNTQRIRVAGPLNLQEWQALTVMLVATNMYQHTLFGKAIHIFGVPTSPATFSCYYQSKYAVMDSTAPTGLSESFITDASTTRIPSYLVLADLNWRWKSKKGLPYAEEQRVAESMLFNAVGRQSEGTLYLDGDDWRGASLGPSLIVPLSAGGGNWPT